ncbi:MAG: hypothetical protein R2705_16470 [Ilumatobacteraceae bacterium]
MKGVTGLLIVSGGFSDRGPAGREAEQAVIELARRNGMRAIGPNSMGVVNTDPEIRLNATLAPTNPPGRIGFMSQSGGSASGCWPRATPAIWGVDVRRRRQQGRRLPVTTCSSTGNSTLGPMWCSCTSNRSAIRASSPRSPVGWRGPSRSWR